MCYQHFQQTVYQYNCKETLEKKLNAGIQFNVRVCTFQMKSSIKVKVTNILI